MPKKTSETGTQDYSKAYATNVISHIGNTDEPANASMRIISLFVLLPDEKRLQIYRPVCKIRSSLI